MGRRKIAIRPIAEERNRSVTFIKRKAGLFKKAHELAVLCQVDVALVIVAPNGKIFEYATAPVDKVMTRYDPKKIYEARGPRDYADLSGDTGVGIHSMQASEESDGESIDPGSVSVDKRTSTPGTTSADSGVELASPSPTGQTQGQQVPPPQAQSHKSTPQQSQAQFSQVSQTSAAPVSPSPVGQPPISQVPGYPPRGPGIPPGYPGFVGVPGAGQLPPQMAGQYPNQMAGQMAGQIPGQMMNFQGRVMPPPRAGQRMNPYIGMEAYAMNRPPQTPQHIPFSPSAQAQQTPSRDQQGRDENPPEDTHEKRPKLKVQIPGTESPSEQSGTPSPATQAGSATSSHKPSLPPVSGGAQSHVPAHSQAQAQMRLQMQAGRASAGLSRGGWSAYPQSPMGYLVSAQPDAPPERQTVIPPSQQQIENATPISAALPSRYMNDMLASPSNFFSMEWGVAWEGGPQSAGPSGPASAGSRPLLPQPPAQTQQQTAPEPSPLQYTPTAGNERKRLSNGQGPDSKKAA